MRRRLERILIVAGVCLPVPLLAITGLSIPLPAVVERIAAALVPWAEAATLDADGLALGMHGAIVFADGEGTGSEPTEEPDRSALKIGEASPPGSGSAPAGGSGGGGNSTPNDDGGGKSKPPPANPGPGDEDPKEEPGLVDETVDTVEKTVEPVADEVDDVLDGVGDTVDEAKEELLGDLP